MWSTADDITVCGFRLIMWLPCDTETEKALRCVYIEVKRRNYEGLKGSQLFNLSDI